MFPINSSDPPPIIFFVIFLALTTSQIIEKFLSIYLNVHLPRKVIALTVILVVYYLIPIEPKFMVLIKETLNFPPEYLFTFFYPAYVLRIVRTLDKGVFIRMLPISLPLSMCTTLVGILSGFVMSTHRDGWSTNDCLIFGMFFVNTQPFFMNYILGTLEKYKIVQHILMSEALLTIVWMQIVNGIFIDVYRGNVHSATQVVETLGIEIFGGLLVAFLLSRIVALPLKYIVLDVESTAVYIICALMVCYVSVQQIYISGYLTLLYITMHVITERTNYASGKEAALKVMIYTLFLFIELSLFTFCFMRLLLLKDSVFDFHSVYIYLFHYVILMTLRFFFTGGLFLIMRRLKAHTLNTSTCFLVGLVCPINDCNLLYIILLIRDEATKHIAMISIPYVVTVGICSILINNTGLSIILKIVNASNASTKRIETINTALQYITYHRDLYINTMKSTKLFSNTNWPLVRKWTVLKLSAPYPRYLTQFMSVNNKTTDVPQSRQCCEKCPLDSNVDYNLENYYKDLNELIRLMKVHVAKQRDLGFISPKAVPFLCEMIDMYNTPEVNKYEQLEKLFKKRHSVLILRKINKKFFNIEWGDCQMPRKYYRQICYKITANRWFRFLIYMVIIFSLLPVLLEYVKDPIIQRFHHLELYIYTFIFFIFAGEFVLTILSYSFIKICADGFRTYFRSPWHILDFISLSLMSIEVTMQWYRALYDVPLSGTAREVFFWLRMLRALRLFKFITTAIPTILITLEADMEYRTNFAVEITLAFNTVLYYAQNVVQQYSEQDFYKTIQQVLYEDLLMTYTIINRVQTELPWLVTTYKTKQILGACRQRMMFGLEYLKSSGLVDSYEHTLLTKSIYNKYKRVKHLAKIRPTLPIQLFYGIPWMKCGQNVEAFLRQNSTVRFFSKGQVLYAKGNRADAVMIVISGLVKCKYTPDNEIIINIRNGVLPIVDNFNITRVSNFNDAYILIGNGMGELSILTNRAYNCDIIAASDVRVYNIPAHYIRLAMKMNPNPIHGLSSIMWKYKVHALAKTMLLTSPNLDFKSVWDVHEKLSRAFVPTLICYNIFVVLDEIEDVVLVDGRVTDDYTKVEYVAPCHLPHSAARLVLHQENERAPAKLLIIPNDSVDTYKLMEKEERIAVLKKHDILRCPHHIKRSNKRTMYRKLPDPAFNLNVSPFLSSRLNENSIPATSRESLNAVALEERSSMSRSESVCETKLEESFNVLHQ